MTEFAGTAMRVSGVEIFLAEHIASGTTADVYKGKIGRRRVAAKVFYDHDHASTSIEHRYLEEIRISLSIRHTNITRGLVGGRDEQSRRLVLVMPYHQGVSLGTHLPVVDQLPWTERAQVATELLRQMSGALGYLAYRGLTHRDIKPDNIQIRPDRQHFLLMDLGLTRAGDRDIKFPTSWEINGASRFRSPAKWVDFHRATPTDDLWSLGVVAYRIMNGVYPFGTSNEEGSEERLREMIFHGLPAQRNAHGDADSVKWDRLLANILRRDQEFRIPISALRRKLAASTTKGRLQESNGSRSLARHVRRLGNAAERTTGELFLPEPKVALLSERLLTLDSRGPSDGRMNIGSRAVQWLIDNNDNGQFQSRSIGSATVYCTALATLALSRASSWPDLSSELRRAAGRDRGIR